jgi:heme-degrading monooxygenase HmoA
MPAFSFDPIQVRAAANYHTCNDQLYGGDTMFVIVISFPPIKVGKDAEFREWFAVTNEQFSTFKGFIRRRLLKPLGEGNYTAIVEFENQDAFEATRSSPAHDKAGERVRPLFEGSPMPRFYEVAIG